MPALIKKNYINANDTTGCLSNTRNISHDKYLFTNKYDSKLI